MKAVVRVKDLMPLFIYFLIKKTEGPNALRRTATCITGALYVYMCGRTYVVFYVTCIYSNVS